MTQTTQPVKSPKTTQQAAAAPATSEATQEHPTQDQAVQAAMASLREGVIYVDDVDEKADVVPDEEDTDVVDTDQPASESQMKVYEGLQHILDTLDGKEPGSVEFIEALDEAVTSMELMITDHREELDQTAPSEAELAAAQTNDGEAPGSMLELMEQTLEMLHTYQSVQWGLGGSLGDDDGFDDDGDMDGAETFTDEDVTYLSSMREDTEEQAYPELPVLSASAASKLPKKVKWAGILGYEGVATGDGRQINLNALQWEQPVGPLRFVLSDYGAHDGAQVVGRILQVERRDGGVVWGTGDLDMGSEAGREAYRVMRHKYVNGVSLDLDEVSFEVRAMPKPSSSNVPVEAKASDSLAEDGSKTLMKVTPSDEMTITTKARVRAATLLAIPAFSGARIYIVEEDGVAVDPNAEVADDDDDADQAVVATTFALETVDDDIDPDLYETDWTAALGMLEDFQDDDEDDEDDEDDDYDDEDDEDDGTSVMESSESEEYRKKRKGNWVSRTGGLPKYIKKISKHLRKKGMTEGHAIATAVNVVKKMCATGDLNYPGKQNANPISRAKACAAVAEWEAKKKAAKAKAVDRTFTFAKKAEFEESKHKRAPDGRFTEKDGGSSSSTSTKKAPTSTSKSSKPSSAVSSKPKRGSAVSSIPKTSAAPSPSAASQKAATSSKSSIPLPDIPEMLRGMLEQVGWKVEKGKLVPPAGGATGEHKRIKRRRVEFKANTRRIPVKRVKPVKSKKASDAEKKAKAKKAAEKKAKKAKAKAAKKAKKAKKTVDMSWHIPARSWKRSTKAAGTTFVFRNVGGAIRSFAEQAEAVQDPRQAVETLLENVDLAFETAKVFPQEGPDAPQVNQWFVGAMDTVEELTLRDELMADPDVKGFEILVDRLITAQEMLVEDDFVLLLMDGEPTPEMEGHLIQTVQNVSNLLQATLNQISPPAPAESAPAQT